MSDIENFMPEEVNALEEFRYVDPYAYDFSKCGTRMDPIGPYIRKDVYAALIVTGGNLKKAADLLGRTRDSLNRWLKSRPDMLAIKTDLEEGFLDECEDAMREKVTVEKDAGMIRFALQTKGKSRGYTTKVEGGAGTNLAELIAARVSESQLVNIARELVRREEGELVDVTPTRLDT